jgi:hypothetical protein
MMTNGEIVAAPELHPPLPPPLPGDVNDALRKAYNAAKNTVELRPVIDQTILNAARENARQSIPFYKKIPWYTQFSMAGAVFGSLLLSAVVLYKTVVHKHDKAVEELVMAEVAVKNEDARKKAPMVVSILAENSNPPTAALAPAEPAARVTTATIEPAKPVIMAAAAPLPETKTEIAAAAPSVQSITTVVALKPAAKADTDTAARVQDKIVMADATALSKDLSRNRMPASDSPGQAGNASAGNAFKAKEANIIVGQLAPPPTAPAPAAVRALAPQIVAAPAAPAAPAVLATPPVAPPLSASAGTVPVEAAPAWLSRIEALQRAGKTAQAKTELQALLKRYPDTVLTTELKRLLAD